MQGISHQTGTYLSQRPFLTPKMKQAISARERALCQLCVLSFTVEVTEEHKIVPCKWCSEGK